MQVEEYKGVVVRHRNGKLSPYDPRATLDVIDWAVDGMKVDQEDLVDKMRVRFDAGEITTRSIQEGLINAAHELASLEAPDWILVAGRLKMRDYFKETLTNRGWGYGAYLRSLRYQRERGRYDGQLMEQLESRYSESELRMAGRWIRPERDHRYTIAGASLLTSRYLVKEELPQEMFLTQSLLLAMNEEKRMEVARRYYEHLSQGFISLATPVLANLRRRNGSLTSCFLLDMDDNLVGGHGIFPTLSYIAAMSKNGGGVGVRVSRIRAKGSPVNKSEGTSAGVPPWVRLIDDTAIAVNQEG